MKTKAALTGWLTVLAPFTINLQFSSVLAQAESTTCFTYQGCVLDNGANFNGAGQFNFALVTSTNASHQATASANPPNGGLITIINVTDGGIGYTSPPAVTISGGGGSGATAIATISGGGVTAIAVHNPGSGYTSTPTVTLDPPPANITYTTYWSNDGTSVDGSEPSAAVDVSVNNDLFTVTLGDVTVPNMSALEAALFTRPNLELRIWFDDGANAFAVLDPAQNLTPAPYAAFASSASSASNLLGMLSSAQLSGPIVNRQLASNSITVAAGNGLSGGGTVPLGGAVTLNNAGVLDVVGSRNITLAHILKSGIWTVGDNGTNANLTHTSGWSVNSSWTTSNGTNSITINQPSGNLFFRLAK